VSLSLEHLTVRLCLTGYTGKTYEAIKQLANSQGIFASDHKLFSETAYVRKLLGQFEMISSDNEIPFESWEGLPDCSLLATKFHIEQGKACWHWSVFIRQDEKSYVLDPAKHLEGSRRMDFENIQVKWFIVVKPG
jgi:hypothetical protein